MAESLKIVLLNAIGNSRAMETLLRSMTDRTRAEFCAFYTARGGELLYLMLESRELSPWVAEIREKLKKTYRMFTNEPGPDVEPTEHISFKRLGGNVRYLLGNSKIESYFLVPVSFDSVVRGVLYFGSVRKEAFGKNDIAEFRNLADEGEEKVPIIFRIGGEREVFDRMLDAMPEGAALVSREGAIVAMNSSFTDMLLIRDSVPESVSEIGKASPFALDGLWDEFRVLRRNLADRELAGLGAPTRHIAVTWVKLDDFSEDVDSLVLLRDLTSQREQAEAREEMVATVAHELRTPLTALKSSLAILANHQSAPAAIETSGRGVWSGAGAASVPGIPLEKFLTNALRTVDRLGRLVDGLIDASAARADERSLRFESLDARQLLADASILFLEPMRAKGIDFTIDIDREISRIIADRDRIEQVIQNLLANSIKHVPSGGKISIVAAPCRGCAHSMLPAMVIKHVPSVRFIDLCLRDTGSGIPRQVAERINPDPGFPDRPAQGARGLGLYIARRLIRMHGGSLSIEGSSGEGSLVHLYLPAEEATARIVQRYRAAETTVGAMIARGLAPVVCCVEKHSAQTWDSAAAGWGDSIAVDPMPDETSMHSKLLWPFAEELAIAVSAAPVLIAPSEQSNQGTLSTEIGERHWGPGTRCGWAIGPREGLNLRDLITVAGQRMSAGNAAFAWKGDVP